MAGKSPTAGSNDDTLVAETPANTTRNGAGDPLAGADPEAAGEASTGKRSTTDTIREEAGKLGTQAAERARAFAGEGKDRATGALDELAKMMRNAAVDVDEKLGADYGKYARSAADGIGGFAESLRGKQVDDLFDDATALVRKSPVIAIGAAAAVGFVLARLIKSGIDAAADLADRDEPTGSGKA